MSYLLSSVLSCYSAGAGLLHMGTPIKEEPRYRESGTWRDMLAHGDIWRDMVTHAAHDRTWRHTASRGGTWRHMAAHGATWWHMAAHGNNMPRCAAMCRHEAPCAAMRRHVAPCAAMWRHVQPCAAVCLHNTKLRARRQRERSLQHVVRATERKRLIGNAVCAGIASPGRQRAQRLPCGRRSRTVASIVSEADSYLHTMTFFFRVCGA